MRAVIRQRQLGSKVAPLYLLDPENFSPCLVHYLFTTANFILRALTEKLTGENLKDKQPWICLLMLQV